MELMIIRIYCVVDDFLKSIRFKEDVQVKLNMSEILTIGLVATKYFGGNYATSIKFMIDHRYVKSKISRGQFSRRLNSLDESVFEQMSYALSEHFKRENVEQKYNIDSAPIVICQNERISRCKLVSGKEYLGYSATKNSYFYGLRLHLLASIKREPIEWRLVPAKAHDMTIFREFELNLPDGAQLGADSAYTDYNYEDIIHEATNFSFLPNRKSNSKRPYPPHVTFLASRDRKSIETTFSQITALFPKKIHATNFAGFFLKIQLFILTYAISCLF